jgi:DNA-binding NarL/FixJ family response regulator
VVQERFLRLLRRTGFEIVLRPEFGLPETTSAGRPAEGVAVIDGGDIDRTLQFLSHLRFEHSELRLLVLVPQLEAAVAYPLLRLGVKGLVAYDLAARELCRAARQVMLGGYWVPRELLTRFIESILPELHGCKSLEAGVDISRREREVLDLLLENLSNKEIGSKLFVSERTVKFHVSNLLSKFQVQRRADLIVMWMQRNHSLPWHPPTVAPIASTHIN